MIAYGCFRNLMIRCGYASGQWVSWGRLGMGGGAREPWADESEKAEACGLWADIKRKPPSDDRKLRKRKL